MLIQREGELLKGKRVEERAPLTRSCSSFIGNSPYLPLTSRRLEPLPAQYRFIRYESFSNITVLSFLIARKPGLTIA